MCYICLISENMHKCEHGNRYTHIGELKPLKGIIVALKLRM